MSKQRPLLFEFNTDKTFADYFPGENYATLEHLKRCINGTGEAFIYLWGGPGLGKSHLLQACCHKARLHAKNAFYLSLEKSNLPEKEVLDGLQDYPLLCIDNIDSISGNNAWEYAFFTFFNQVRDAGGAMILTATLPAAGLSIALSDLKTRLAWGLTLKLKNLNETDKVAALSFKAHRAGFEISPQVGQFLLSHYARDLSSLWQLLEEIEHETLAAKRRLTIPFLKQIMQKTP